MDTYISKNLIRLRAINNLTQNQVAEGIGISKRSYERYETNEVEPNYYRLVQIAMFYEIPVSELTEDKKDMAIKKKWL